MVSYVWSGRQEASLDELNFIDVLVFQLFAVSKSIASFCDPLSFL